VSAFDQAQLASKSVAAAEQHSSRGNTVFCANLARRSDGVGSSRGKSPRKSATPTKGGDKTMTGVTSRIEMYGYFVICDSSSRPEGFPEDCTTVGHLLVAHSSNMAAELIQRLTADPSITVIACFAPSIPYKWWSGECRRVPNDYGPFPDLNYQMPYGMVVDLAAAVGGLDPRCEVSRGMLKVTPTVSEVEEFADRYLKYETGPSVRDFWQNMVNYYGTTRWVDLHGRTAGCLVLSPAANIFDDGLCTMNAASIAPGALQQTECCREVFDSFAEDSREALSNISVISGIYEWDTQPDWNAFNRRTMPTTAYMVSDRFDSAHSVTISNNRYRNIHEFESLSKIVIKFEPSVICMSADGDHHVDLDCHDDYLDVVPVKDDADASCLSVEQQMDADAIAARRQYWGDDQQERRLDEPDLPELVQVHEAPSRAKEESREESPTDHEEQVQTHRSRDPWLLDDISIRNAKEMAPKLLKNERFIGSLCILVGGKAGASHLQWKKGS